MIKIYESLYKVVWKSAILVFLRYIVGIFQKNRVKSRRNPVFTRV